MRPKEILAALFMILDGVLRRIAYKAMNTK